MMSSFSFHLKLVVLSLVLLASGQFKCRGFKWERMRRSDENNKWNSHMGYRYGGNNRFQDDPNSPIAQPMPTISPPVNEPLDMAWWELQKWLPKQCGRRPANRRRTLFTLGDGIVLKGRYPSYVRVDTMIGKDASYSCGGTLISNRHVLTSAKCLMNAKSVYVAHLKPPTGNGSKDATDWTPTSHKIQAGNRCSSSEYNLEVSPIHHDMALLTLNQPVQFHDFLQPACLPKWPIEEGMSPWVAVGSLMESAPDDDVNLLKPIEINRLNMLLTDCEAASSKHPTNVCMVGKSKRGRGTCLGNEGGPIYGYEGDLMVLAAITSEHGNKYCGPHNSKVSTHTNVHKTLGDIVNLMKQCGGVTGATSPPEPRQRSINLKW